MKEEIRMTPSQCHERKKAQGSYPGSMLSNTGTTSHMWPFKLKLIKIK